MGMNGDRTIQTVQSCEFDGDDRKPPNLAAFRLFSLPHLMSRNLSLNLSTIHHVYHALGDVVLGWMPKEFECTEGPILSDEGFVYEAWEAARGALCPKCGLRSSNDDRHGLWIPKF